MNWYQLSLGEPKIIDSKCIKLADISMIKTAYSTRDHEIKYATHDTNDGYFVKVQLTENKNKIVLVAQFLSNLHAYPLYKDTWHYDKKEGGRALKTYNRVVNVLEDLKIDFEDDETPGPTLQGMAREELRFVDIDRKKDANNVSLNASKYGAGEGDWRSSLYSNHYPVVNITNTNGGIVNFNGTQT